MITAAMADDGLARFVSGRWGNGLRRIALLTLLALFALQLAQMTWRLLPAVDLPQPPVEQVIEAAVAAPTDDRRLEAIAGYHLFGKEQPKPVAPMAVALDAPQTQLKLKLLGVIASEDPERALAIIAEPGGSQDFYGIEGHSASGTIKMEVPGGATIRQIFADRVILLRNGREESLPLATEGGGGRSVQVPNRSIPSPRTTPAFQRPTPRQRAALPRRR